MATVNVSWTAMSQTVPASSDLSQYAVDIGPGTVQLVPDGTLTASFLNVAPGDYTATVNASNADGSHVDFPKSTTFNVPIPTKTINVPDVVSVQVV